jgi:hypothetical protein
MSGRSPIDGSTVTLAFTENEISGSAGCRSYIGSYVANRDEIHFLRLGMVELDCLKPRAFSPAGRTIHRQLHVGDQLPPERGQT